MRDPKHPRPGSMSDTDRALIGRDRRIAPAQGVPVQSDPHRDSDAIRLWQHVDAQDQRLDKLDRAIVDISGVSGQNGKLGALKARVDQAEARRWWLLTFAAGTIVTVLGAAIVFGRWMGAMETSVEALKERAPRAQQGDP